MRVRFTAVSALACIAMMLGAATTSTRADSPHAWPTTTAPGAPADTLQSRFPPPAGFERVPAEPQSWAAFLRGLPLKPRGAPVLTFTGARKARQDVHAAVIDMDVGTKDLQQCADAVMRLRAEWLWRAGRAREVAFDYTGGGRVPFARWSAGERPDQHGKSWRAGAKPDASYASFRKYLEQVMIYAGTYSLARELKPVALERLEAGDVFITGGFPGHAVLVADVARNAATGATRFLLVQSYMPAQDIHVLKHPAGSDGSPWYALDFGATLRTPEWSFPRAALKRWP